QRVAQIVGEGAEEAEEDTARGNADDLGCDASDAPDAHVFAELAGVGQDGDGEGLVYAVVGAVAEAEEDGGEGEGEPGGGEEEEEDGPDALLDEEAGEEDPAVVGVLFRVDPEATEEFAEDEGLDDPFLRLLFYDEHGEEDEEGLDGDDDTVDEDQLAAIGLKA